ncbi:MAG: hypothetical protein JWQ72_2671 [Polaromonas sp.]|nr:hypothetical protein [Polaromonas sp.]
MARYGEKASAKVETTLHELKEGELKSGSGQKVTSRKQAIAIGLSEARKEGGKVPPPARKTAAKKAPAKRAATDRPAASEAPSRKAAAKKAPAKKSSGRTKAA